VPCKSGILNIGERVLHPREARLFTTTAIAAPWHAEPQPCPLWMDFLHRLWGDDQESIQTLQEIFGYLLTNDTSQQKIFMLAGKPRSGKGTIARVLTALLGGDEAVTAPTIKSFEGAHGLAPLVGKSLAIIGDARIDRKTDQAQLVELWLSISGEDRQTVNPKNKPRSTSRSPRGSWCS